VLFVSIDQIEKEPVSQKTLVFDSDDPGTVIGQNHRTVRAGQQARKVQDIDAG
jgi:predicted RNA-binding protein YlqC (UPF0109 family)